MFMEITIKEIAKLSGVGITTVSRVINNSGPVSPKTREKIMSVVREYNYVPNNSARNLKSNQSKSVALLVKSITNPFFQNMIKVIEQKVSLRGYQLIIQNVTSVQNELDIAISEAKDRNLQGVILMGGSFNYTEAKLSLLKIPCVLLTISAGEEISLNRYASVRINDELEAFKAVEYLISLGHRRIGFIMNAPVDELTPNSLRYKGYLRALEQYDIPFNPSLVASEFSSLSGFDFGFKMMKQLLMHNRDMTAVFAFADIVAIGAAKAILSSGLKIPENISLIGFDGIEEAEFYHPSIDTISQPAEQMALASVEVLFDMLQGGETKHMVFESSLLKRGSCIAVHK
ncbi:MAG: LacI family transcriptional regulator [Anaerocolumna sp.]|jgi:LacI family transcriptional regulator|nr:LacI family transcriptional regulator [Anaerocolumna sp.]